MWGIILAAGRGSRMGELTQQCHKSSLKFRGQSLMDWQLKALKQGGVSQIAIVTGYMEQQVSRLEYRSYFNSEWQDTNMLYSLIHAKDILVSHQCIISYSDIIYHPSVVSKLLTTDGDFCVAYDENWEKIWSARFDNIYDDAEQLLIVNGQITKIGSRLKLGDPNCGQYMGLIKTKPTFWRWFFESYQDHNKLKSRDMTSFISYLISVHAISVVGTACDEEWFEFDQPSDFTVANNLLSDKYFN